MVEVQFKVFDDVPVVAIGTKYSCTLQLCTTTAVFIVYHRCHFENFDLDATHLGE